MQGLDYVVAQAALHGIRLILTLTNYWPDYGRAHKSAGVLLWMRHCKPQGLHNFTLTLPYATLWLGLLWDTAYL